MVGFVGSRGVRFFSVVFALGLVACGGKAAVTDDGEPVATGLAGSSNAAPGETNGVASNGVIVPELRATGLPLGSVLGQLNAASTASVCKALGAWVFRISPQACYAFVESALVIQERTQAEDRQLCQDNLGICHSPTEPMPACTSFPASCAVTLAELDRCFADRELWFNAVPACQEMTRATAPRGMGPSPASCKVFDTTCYQQ